MCSSMDSCWMWLKFLLHPKCSPLGPLVYEYPSNPMSTDVRLALQMLSHQGTDPGGADPSHCKWSPSYSCTTNFLQPLEDGTLSRQPRLCMRDLTCDPAVSISEMMSHVGSVPLPPPCQLPSLCSRAQLGWDGGWGGWGMLPNHCGREDGGLVETLCSCVQQVMIRTTNALAPFSILEVEILLICFPPV